MASMPNHWSFDVHRSSPISIEWRQQYSCRRPQGGGGLSGVQAVLGRRLLLADAVQVVVVGDDEAGAEETLAMDHLSASFWRAKRCLLQQSVKDEAIHRSNSHLDHRKAGEEGGTLGGASNKKRWWKKISTLFFELAPKNGTQLFLEGERVRKWTSYSTKYLVLTYMYYYSIVHSR